MAKSTQTATVVPSTESVDTFKWNNYSIPVADVPHVSIMIMARRGFTHVMGNEAAAYATGLKAKTNDDGTRKFSDSVIEIMVDTWRMEKLAEMAAGTMSFRVSGPRLPKEERLTLDVAREHLVAAFVANPKATPPKAADTKAWDALIESYLATPKGAESVKAEVTRRMAGATVDDDTLALVLAATKAA